MFREEREMVLVQGNIYVLKVLLLKVDVMNVG